MDLKIKVDSFDYSGVVQFDTSLVTPELAKEINMFFYEGESLARIHGGHYEALAVRIFRGIFDKIVADYNEKFALNELREWDGFCALPEGGVKVIVHEYPTCPEDDEFEVSRL